MARSKSMNQKIDEFEFLPNVQEYLDFNYLKRIHELNFIKSNYSSKRTMKIFE